MYDRWKRDRLIDILTEAAATVGWHLDMESTTYSHKKCAYPYADITTFVFHNEDGRYFHTVHWSLCIDDVKEMANVIIDHAIKAFNDMVENRKKIEQTQNNIDEFIKKERIMTNKQAVNSIYGSRAFRKYVNYSKIIDNQNKIKKVIFNPPATIVFWMDGTKTVVKARGDDEYDPEKGMAMAFSKKFLGNEYEYYNVFKHWLKQRKVKGE